MLQSVRCEIIVKVSANPNLWVIGCVILSSFLSDRSQTVITPAPKSNPVLLEYGVTQGSVLRPLLYTLFTTSLHSIISKYPALRCNFYADDTQIYLSFSPEWASSAFTSIETCIKDIF